MKKLVGLSWLLLAVGCTSNPKKPETVAEPVIMIPMRKQDPVMPATPKRMNFNDIRVQLGLERDSRQLGFLEKDYDSCKMLTPGDEPMCGQRYMSVMNFRLVCRDTVGTTTRAPTSLTPLRSQMQWRLNGKRGQIRTDKDGYGQMQMISRAPSKEKQFILVIGKNILGVEAGEVTQIVVPRNWCAGTSP